MMIQYLDEFTESSTIFYLEWELIFQVTLPDIFPKFIDTDLKVRFDHILTLNDNNEVVTSIKETKDWSYKIGHWSTFYAADRGVFTPGGPCDPYNFTRAFDSIDDARLYGIFLKEKGLWGSMGYVKNEFTNEDIHKYLRSHSKETSVGDYERAMKLAII